MAKPKLEPELLKDAPMRYAPTNEMGVVFLFSHLCRRMQLHIESVQGGFPDCIARQRIGGKERLIRIEFEFRSSNFRAHGHAIDGCDWIVCWEHDWVNAPSNITVVELQQYFGHVFNVWALVLAPDDDWPMTGKYGFTKRVTKGDLILVYEWSPRMWFRHLYTVIGNSEAPNSDASREAHYHCKYHIVPSSEPVFHGLFVHKLRKVCTLQKPLPRKTLDADRLISKNPVHSQQGNRKITEHWWRFYELIIRRNPDCVATLEKFSPSKV